MAEKKTSWLDQQFGGKIFVYPLVPSLFAFILAIVSSFIVNFSDIRSALFKFIPVSTPDLDSLSSFLFDWLWAIVFARRNTAFAPPS